MDDESPRGHKVDRTPRLRAFLPPKPPGSPLTLRPDARFPCHAPNPLPWQR
jgi:hypothetical protein